VSSSNIAETCNNPLTPRLEATDNARVALNLKKEHAKNREALTKGTKKQRYCYYFCRYRKRIVRCEKENRSEQVFGAKRDQTITDMQESKEH